MEASQSTIHPDASGAAPRVATVVRNRLLERLEERHWSRLTTVVGGAGSGKTTLLAHALRVDGPWIDIWYPCGPGDRSNDRLISGLVGRTAIALGRDVLDEHDDPLVELGELVLAAAPRSVCLVIDDAQMIGGSDIIDQLLDHLPTNGHLLVAGRSIPKHNDARLDTRGELTRIDQTELMLTDDELVEFANLRGIDVVALDAAERWPAFAELAARGLRGAAEGFLEQEVLDGIETERREALAAFSFVGGGDDAIAEAVAGMTCADLTDGLPLVRWAADVAILHDLWGDLLADVQTADARNAAAHAAAMVHLGRRSLDTAVHLLAAIDDWDAVEAAMASAVREGVDDGLQKATLNRWIGLLPTDRRDRPVALLLRGILARELDPTAPEAVALLDEAAAGFHDAGNAELELVALLQLGYVARVSMDASRIGPVIERLTALADYHAPARPFLAFGEGFLAIAAFRHDRLLAAMESIVDADLPKVWQLSRDSWISDAHRTLGSPDKALAVAPGMDAFSTPVPGALVSRSMSLWMSGRPIDARTERSLGLEHRFGARDRATAGNWIALMDAWAGDVGGALDALSVSRSFAGQSPPTSHFVQTLGVEIVLQVVDADEAGAAMRLEELLTLAPLDDGLSAMQLRNFIALPYVLVPSTRTYWDHAELGPSIRQARDAARALVDARLDDRHAIASMRWPDPAILAVTFPLPMAIEFALRGARSGRNEGYRLARWLCEHWGAAARTALQDWRDDDELGITCSDVLARTPLPPTEVVSIHVLGQATLLVDGYASSDPDWRRQRVRALLVWLIVHRQGSREQIAGRIWPDLDADKAARNLRTTLNYLHGVLEPTRPSGQAPWSVRVDGSDISLEPSMDVDAWKFAATLDLADDAQREGRVTAALPLLLDAVQLYRGDIAPDLDVEWLDLERIHLRSRFVRAACRAAELLVALDRAGEAVDVAHRALGVDPWHEPGYKVLASAYERLGDATSAREVAHRFEARLDAF